MHPFLHQSLRFSLDLLNIFMVFQWGFVIFDKVFGCGNPTDNPSPVWELNLLTQFSGITTLEYLVLEKQC